VRYNVRMHNNNNNNVHATSRGVVDVAKYLPVVGVKLLVNEHSHS